VEHIGPSIIVAASDGLFIPFVLVFNKQPQVGIGFGLPCGSFCLPDAHSKFSLRRGTPEASPLSTMMGTAGPGHAGFGLYASCQAGQPPHPLHNS